jgi:hypothetical protein
MEAQPVNFRSPDGRVGSFLNRAYRTMPSANPILARIYLFLHRFTVPFTDCLISAGEELKQRCIQRRIGDPSKHRCIHSGMQVDPFYKAEGLSKEGVTKKRRELRVVDDGMIIGKVAALGPRKGHE